MTTQEIANMIDSVGVPYAYYQFSEATAKPCPFICFFYAGDDDFIADNKNYQKINRLIVELYTDTKDFYLETEVEDALNDHGLVYTKEEVYIDTERMFQITYESEVIINAEQN